MMLLQWNFDLLHLSILKLLIRLSFPEILSIYCEVHENCQGCHPAWVAGGNASTVLLWEWSMIKELNHTCFSSSLLLDPARRSCWGIRMMSVCLERAFGGAWTATSRPVWVPSSTTCTVWASRVTKSAQEALSTEARVTVYLLPYILSAYVHIVPFSTQEIDNSTRGILFTDHLAEFQLLLNKELGMVTWNTWTSYFFVLSTIKIDFN